MNKSVFVGDTVGTGDTDARPIVFSVDESAKDELGRYAKSYVMPKMRGYVWSYRILYFLIAVCMLVVCALLVPRMLEYGVEDAVGYAIVLMFAFCIALLLSIIPMCIQNLAKKKFLWKWCGRTHEGISLHKKYLIWSHCDLCEDGKLPYQPAGEIFYQYKMSYSDIKQLVYNRGERVLYVYGYMSGVEYADSTRSMILETIELDRTLQEVPWMTIPNYYKDFDLLRSELENRTGLRIYEWGDQL